MQYLVFADIEFNGFIIGVFESYLEAEIVKYNTWILGDPPSSLSLEDIEALFKSRNLISYQLNDDNMFENQSLECQSNGFYTVGIFELEDELTAEFYAMMRAES